MQFDILKQAYDKQWLIPSLASRVAHIAYHNPEMQDNINDMFPGYQGLQDSQGLDETLSSCLLNLVRCMNGSTMDALIGHDAMKTMLDLPEDATEQDVLRAVLTKDYDNLKGLLASISKQASTNVGLSSYRGTLFSGEAASDVETTTGDAKSAAEPEQ